MQKVKIADHMLFMTYPLVRDPKLLLAIMDNILASLDCGMSALLHYEKLFKRIPPFNDSFSSKLEIFKNKMVPLHHLSPKYVQLIGDVKSIISDHRNSPVTFARKDKFVICSPSYTLKTLDINMIKKYVFETKLFVDNVSKIVSKNEGIFIRS